MICYYHIIIIIIIIIIIELIHGKIILEITVEIDPQPAALDFKIPSQESRVQNHWVAQRSTQPFILPRSIK